MSGFDSSQDGTSTKVEEAEVSSTIGNSKRSPFRSKPSSQRWLAVLGLVLLTLGVGFGWRWWQANHSGRKPGAMPGIAGGILVKLGTAQAAQVQDSSEYVGSLDSRQSVVLQPEITGRVSQIYVKAGDRVRKGDPLIQVKPQEQEAQLASNLAAVNSARAARSNALSQFQAQEANRIAKQAEVDLQNQQYQRIQALVKEGALPQQQLDQVERDRSKAISELRALDRQIQAARANLAETEAGLQQAKANANVTSVRLQQTTTVAPFDGVVGDIPVKLGQLVSTSDTLTTVTQNEVLELKLAIPLEKVSELREGLPVQLLNNQGGVLSTGRISFVSPQADNRTQSILAKATFDNRSGVLRAGQFAKARVVWRSRPGILVPAAAISRLAGETFIFVAQPMDTTCKEMMSKMPQAGPPAGAPPGKAPILVARQRPVKLGVIQGNSYNILAGLKPNEQIVLSGILNLSECTPIAPVKQ
ncbi:efflux RND transporter periplasmic adaptor subunit [Leptodesmis sp.]|uniref:efflux RND transporter periplasmic adaptor subunit n=1 Tax=Leptodesmis sp. TaxID=3100501 RepID=UPI00405357E3